MNYLTIEDLLPRSGGSVYSLVRMAANRALELSEGKPCLISKPSTDKVTSIALEEILQGKLEMKKSADQRSKGEKADLN